MGKDSIKLNTITLKQGGDGQVFIDIQDSKTVSQQTEYLVKLDKLNQMTGLKQVYIREPRAVNILMSKPERVYLSLFVYGKSVLNKSVRLTQKLQKQYVNEKEGIEYEGKIIAKGDDDIEKVYYLKDNIYRISTIDMNESLYHSLLKLMDENYRDADFEKRIEAVEQIKKKIKTIEDAGKYFNIGIKIYTGKESKIYNPESEEFIMLMSFGDNKFEPLIYLDDEVVSYTFDKDSYLI